MPSDSPSRPSAGPQRFDAREITDTIRRALASAGLDTRSGPMKGVTDTIDQALAAAGLRPRADVTGPRGATVEGVASTVVDERPSAEIVPFPRADVAHRARAGEFASRAFTNHAGTRTYKVYVPAGYRAEASEPVPLVVMLHGCTQTPDDFAAGTRMNALADAHGFLVAYPAQAPHANGTKCWNWFRPDDQGRDQGEPAILAGIAREIAANYRVDERRIFVAGLSAGASMAVILGVTYPEVFAAVGAHSGLPYGAASDMPSAFAAMKGGKANGAGTSSTAGPGAPVIVFHGDRDTTVDARNGAAIVAQAMNARVGAGSPPASTDTGAGPGGRAYSRTVYADGTGDGAVVEHWVLHGAGHAWSGGSPSGSFTDPAGPDASAEMVRFFLSRPVARAS